MGGFHAIIALCEYLINHKNCPIDAETNYQIETKDDQSVIPPQRPNEESDANNSIVLVFSHFSCCLLSSVP